jgi:uncharacterized integral membrane protein
MLPSSLKYIFSLDFVFKTVLLLSVLISFYIFINILVLKKQTYKPMFSTWQFPMLLAIYLEVIYGL